MAVKNRLEVMMNSPCPCGATDKDKSARALPVPRTHVEAQFFSVKCPQAAIQTE
jgi:hypothetical protein